MLRKERVPGFIAKCIFIHLHKVFEKTCERSIARGMRVTGSELIGLVPKKVLIDAGKYFLKKQERSIGISEDEIIKIGSISFLKGTMFEVFSKKDSLRVSRAVTGRATVQKRNMRFRNGSLRVTY